jgi:chromosome segregation ATPase
MAHVILAPTYFYLFEGLGAKSQLEEADSRGSRLQADLDHACEDLEAVREELRQEQTARAGTEKTLADLRIEAATLTERAAHMDELRAVLKTLQERQGRAVPKGRSKPESSA